MYKRLNLQLKVKMKQSIPTYIFKIKILISIYSKYLKWM